MRLISAVPGVQIPSPPPLRNQQIDSMSYYVSEFQSELYKNFDFIYNNRIGIAVSGGPDSVALLLLMHSVQELRKHLVVLHFDHKLRKKSSDDRIFVKNLARKLSLPFLTGSSDVEEFHKNNKMSPEESARIVRYNFFENSAKIMGLDFIAVAHTADDQVETVLLRMVRGSGLGGISGIHARRGIFVRPLLSFVRKDLIAFLNENNQEYRIDETNNDTRYRRNYIRINIIPSLRKLNTNLSVTVSRNVKYLNDENNFIDNEMFKRLKFFSRKTDFWEITRDKFLNFEKVLQFRLINFFYMKVTGSFYNPPLNFTENALSRIKKGTGAALYGDFRVSVSCGYIAFTNKKNDFPINIELDLKKKIKIGNVTIKADYGKKPAKFPLYKYEKKSNSLYFDLHKTTGKIHLRTAREGDRFVPFGMKNEVKIFRFLMKKMIPVYFRKYIYILCDEQGIIAALPVQIDNRVKVDMQSRMIIKINCRNGS